MHLLSSFRSAERVSTLSICLGLIFGVLAHQEPNAAEKAIRLDSSNAKLGDLRSAVCEVAHYANLAESDFSFRSDYVDPDSFALSAFLAVNEEPLSIDTYGESWLTASQNIPALCRFIDTQIRLAGKLRPTSLTAPNPALLSGVNLYYRDIDLNHLLATLYPLVVVTLPQAIDSTLGLLSIGERVFLRDTFVNFVLQDENAANRTSAELDSLEKIERGLAERFALFGARIRPEFISAAGARAFTEALSAVRNFREGVESRDRSFADILFTDVEIPARGASAYLGTTPGWTISGPGDDIHRGDFTVLIDLGGNDYYELSSDISNPHPRIIIDLGGNDIYNGATSYALGAGVFSFDALIDISGDDTYTGKNFALGAGFVGVGVLYDSSGNDRYLGDCFCQGAGCFGFGALIDESGDDLYQAAANCQAFGFVRGCGALCDRAGNDRYISGGKYSDFLRYESHFLTMSQGFGYGYRPYFSGGIGALCDLAGADVYVADIFGQGSSYWRSLGILCDSQGDDQYLAHQYAQGAGAHMTHGLLHDYSGNDFYRSKGVSQGCGHDYSAGVLIDNAGDDSYQCADLSQGAGSANGFGALVDFSGADRYSVSDSANTQGYGNPRREYGSLGVFIDAGGKDDYGALTRENRLRRGVGKWGLGLDCEWPVWFAPSDQSGK